VRARYALALGRGVHRHKLRELGSRAGFDVRADFPGLLVIADAETPVLKGHDAVLVGQLFSASDNHAVEGLDALADSAGSLDRNALLLGHWGNYALFVSPEEGGPRVYRDPSGAIPVYHCRTGAGDVFVSDAELARSLGLVDDSSVDLTFVVHWLQFPYLRSARTGLEKITEVLPGIERRPAGDGWTDTAAWHPTRFTSRKQAILDPKEAAARLRTVALHTIGRQVGSKVVLLQLSGGLDSSMIAACLQDAGVQLTGFNFATRSADGDERRYARAVADLLQIPLEELVEENERSVRAPAELSFRPGTNPLLAPMEGAVEQCAQAIGASLIIDGGGGDNLFCYLNSAAPVADALRWAGIRASARAIDDIAVRADRTWWEVAAAALRRTLTRPRAPKWKENRRFLRMEVLLSSPEMHPWLEGCRGVLRGKREHIEALVHIQHFLDRGAACSRGILHPLMAQPLLELCLRVPTWLWMRGGRDRAVARQAFEGLLPSLVLERRTKGSLQGLLHRAFARMSGEIREMLLTGELRRLDIIDPAAVEQAFANEEWTDDETQLRLSEMAAMELWLQSWRRRPPLARSYR
jgi:asparagine synthase (glutamine-hydrolysing)